MGSWKDPWILFFRCQKTTLKQTSDLDSLWLWLSNLLLEGWSNCGPSLAYNKNGALGGPKTFCLNGFFPQVHGGVL